MDEALHPKEGNGDGRLHWLESRQRKGRAYVVSGHIAFAVFAMVDCFDVGSCRERKTRKKTKSEGSRGIVNPENTLR